MLARPFAPLLVALLLAPASAHGQDAIRPSVVKIHSTVRRPTMTRPWAKSNPQEVSGSGLVIDGNRIITNAHVVVHASQVFVQGYQSADRVPARVVGMGVPVDLAVLEVDDASFFDGRPPLALDDALPAVQDTATVYGYPAGGEELSVTEGIVSRIEMRRVHLVTRSLSIQIDAALNPGNSGGPVMVDGKVAGVAVSQRGQSENIGYIIPSDEVIRFLDDLADGAYDGPARLPIFAQTTENQSLRAMLGLDRDVTGDTIQWVEPVAGLETPLRPLDVITHVAGQPIDNEGRARVRDDLRLGWDYLVARHAKAGTIELTIMRDGASRTIQAPVTTDSGRLIPLLDDAYPRYFIYGPIVFTPAYWEPLQMLPEAWVRRLGGRASPLIRRQADYATFEGEELVLIGSPLLPHPIMKGYDPSLFGVVAAVNGDPVRNLTHLVKTLATLEDEFVVFTFGGLVAETLVFRRAEIEAATEEILNDNGIRNLASDDLLDLWNSRVAR